jgi:hypothetical protein
MKALGAIHGGKKGMNAMIAFLRTCAEALRAIETEDTPAKEAILTVATQLDDKATLLETEEADEAAAGATQEGDTAPAPAEGAPVEEAIASDDKMKATEATIAALTEQVTALVARVDALEADGATKAAAIEEAVKGLTAITTAHGATAAAVEGVQASVKTMGETVQTKLAGMEQQIATSRPGAATGDDKAEKGSVFAGTLFR